MTICPQTIFIIVITVIIYHKYCSHLSITYVSLARGKRFSIRCCVFHPNKPIRRHYAQLLSDQNERKNRFAPSHMQTAVGSQVLLPICCGQSLCSGTTDLELAVKLAMGNCHSPWLVRTAGSLEGFIMIKEGHVLQCNNLPDPLPSPPAAMSLGQRGECEGG